LNSLKGALKDLVVEASDQSARLKRHIEKSTGVLRFKTEEGELLIDADAVRDVIRVNVVLDAIGLLSAHCAVEGSGAHSGCGGRSAHDDRVRIRDRFRGPATADRTVSLPQPPEQIRGGIPLYCG
jgi:hypothetical protein